MTYPELVIFDIDGTIIDHENAARLALEAVRIQVKEISRMSYEDLSDLWGKDFLKLWKGVITGKSTIGGTRVQRFNMILEELGYDPDPEIAYSAAKIYGEVYDNNISAITGAPEMMKELVNMGIRIALLTNNTAMNQKAKLKKANLSGLYDFMLTSEECGVFKPDIRTFEAVLKRVNCSPAKAVMVGNSFEEDVMGAFQAGINPVWFNRFRQSPPENSVNFVEIHSFLPVKHSMKALLTAF